MDQTSGQYILPWFDATHFRDSTYEIRFRQTCRSVKAEGKVLEPLGRAAGVVLESSQMEALFGSELYETLLREQCLIPFKSVLSKSSPEQDRNCEIVIGTRDQPHKLAANLIALSAAVSALPQVSVSVLDFSAPPCFAQNAAAVEREASSFGDAIRHLPAGEVWEFFVNEVPAIRSFNKVRRAFSAEEDSQSASRNLALLLAAGKTLCWVDDGVDLTEIWQHPMADGGLAILSNGRRPDLIRFPRDSGLDGEELIRAEFPESAARCIRYAGASPANVLGDFSRLEVDRLDSRMLSIWFDGIAEFNIATMGYLGGPAPRDLCGFLEAIPASPCELYGHDPVLLSSPATLISRNPTASAPLMALNTRSFIPPFLPSADGGEMLFSALFQLTNSAAMAVHLPHILRGTADREKTSGALPGFRLSFAGILSNIVLNCASQAQHETVPAAAARFIASQLRAFGELSENAQRSCLGEWYRDWASRVTDWLSDEGRSPAISAEERADIRTSLRGLVESHNIFDLIVDWRQSGSRSAFRGFSDVLQSFASLMEVWPSVFTSEARDLAGAFSASAGQNHSGKATRCCATY